MTEDEKALQFRRIEDRERLAVLEIRVSDHEEDLRQVFEHQKILSEGISKIANTLRKIMYAFVGAASLLVLQELGLVSTITALLI